LKLSVVPSPLGNVFQAELGCFWECETMVLFFALSSAA
jgi:hypothetical protein